MSTDPMDAHMLVLGVGLKVQPVFVRFCTLPGGMCKKKKKQKRMC